MRWTEQEQSVYTSEDYALWRGRVARNDNQWGAEIQHLNDIPLKAETPFPSREEAQEWCEVEMRRREPMQISICEVKVMELKSRRPVKASHATPHATPPQAPTRLYELRNTRCQHCGARVPDSKRKDHVRHCRKRRQQNRHTQSTPSHSISVATPRGTSRSVAARGAAGASTSVSQDAFTQSFRDTRDASRDYADRYREQGRFGSYPVHDDYSEESFPD